MQEVPSEHEEALLRYADERAQAHVAQRGYEVFSTRIFKSYLGTGLGTLPRAALLKQGLGQMGPEIPPTSAML